MSDQGVDGVDGRRWRSSSRTTGVVGDRTVLGPEHDQLLRVGGAAVLVGVRRAGSEVADAGRGDRLRGAPVPSFQCGKGQEPGGGPAVVAGLFVCRGSHRSSAGAGGAGTVGMAREQPAPMVGGRRAGRVACWPRRRHVSSGVATTPSSCCWPGWACGPGRSPPSPSTMSTGRRARSSFGARGIASRPAPAGRCRRGSGRAICATAVPRLRVPRVFLRTQAPLVGLSAPASGRRALGLRPSRPVPGGCSSASSQRGDRHVAGRRVAGGGRPGAAPPQHPDHRPLRQGRLRRARSAGVAVAG